MSYLGGSKTSRRYEVNRPDSIDQDIADEDDYKKSRERYVVWSKPHSHYDGSSFPGYNFVMDGHGNIISDQNNIYNPLGFLPFIDISPVKNFKFFVDDKSNICDFAVRMCAQGKGRLILTGRTNPEALLGRPGDSPMREGELEELHDFWSRLSRECEMVIDSPSPEALASRCLLVEAGLGSVR